MGKNERAHMMSLRVFLIIALAIGTCHGHKMTNEVVPEISQMVHKMAFSEMAPTAFIASMTKSGNTKADCRSFATETKSDITSSVASMQATLGAVDTGSGCAAEGQTAVTSAQTALATAQATLVTAQADVVTAQAAKTTACTADVAIPTMGLNEMETLLNTCTLIQGFIQDDAVYIAVKAGCATATATLTAAQADVASATSGVTAAQAALAAAVAEATRLMNECFCRVSNEQAAAWTAATAASTTHVTAWKKAHEIICALDAATTCTVPTCPAVTQPTLAATGMWHVLPSTTLSITPSTGMGPRINHSSPLPVTLTLNLGANIWIVGLVDSSHLKMVKIEITGVSSYNWLETRYSTTYTTACTAQTTFVESCFSGRAPTTNYDLATSCGPGCWIPHPVDLAAGVTDAVCGIQITGMSSFSGTDCMVRDMTTAQQNSGSGDDGGVVFMGGPAGSPDAGHIMYQGDLHLVGLPGDLSTGVATGVATGSGMGSIFSELKANKVYRITTSSTGSNTGAAVYLGRAVTHLQCLANGASTTSGLTDVALP